MNNAYLDIRPTLSPGVYQKQYNKFAVCWENEDSIRSVDEIHLFYVDSLTKDAKAEDSVEENNSHHNSDMDILQEIQITSIHTTMKSPWFRNNRFMLRKI